MLQQAAVFSTVSPTLDWGLLGQPLPPSDWKYPKAVLSIRSEGWDSQNQMEPDYPEGDPGRCRDLLRMSPQGLLAGTASFLSARGIWGYRVRCGLRNAAPQATQEGAAFGAQAQC